MIIQLDLETLFTLNPIAKAQMEAIVALRESKENDEVIKELQDRLNEQEPDGNSE